MSLVATALVNDGVDHAAPITALAFNVDDEGLSFARKSPPPKDRVGEVVGQSTFLVAEQIISLSITNEVSMIT